MVSGKKAEFCEEVVLSPHSWILRIFSGNGFELRWLWEECEIKPEMIDASIKCWIRLVCIANGFWYWLGRLWGISCLLDVRRASASAFIFPVMSMSWNPH